MFGPCVIPLFDFDGNSIRIIDLDGTIWFPAKGVCDGHCCRTRT
ncbi:hypothetical protein R2601_19759 [Salipiger bermudensis HTCC2601]|uniref:Uncharacterized protein n=1 Tax=Salipiger bermudensis (strain DSM 26914 / JCM 13377 / KCTC 12554 / HTCC2601) TaxID=314265 RepID=Q0FTZ2_SALBH|nr:hypothetical protein R2601_19759 [Salipiger bermudensis HTCC2601]